MRTLRQLLPFATAAWFAVSMPLATAQEIISGHGGRGTVFMSGVGQPGGQSGQPSPCLRTDRNPAAAAGLTPLGRFWSGPGATHQSGRVRTR